MFPLRAPEDFAKSSVRPGPGDNLPDPRESRGRPLGVDRRREGFGPHSLDRGAVDRIPGGASELSRDREKQGHEASAIHRIKAVDYDLPLVLAGRLPAAK